MASTHRTGTSSTLARQADGQPGPQRRLSARLDLQALHGAGGAEAASARPTRPSPIPATSTSAATVSATTRKAATALVDMYKSIVVSCDTYYYRWPTTWASTHRRLHGQLGFGSRPASTSKASRAACCPRPNGRRSASRSPSSRNGMPAKPSPSASARATTPTPPPAGAGHGDRGQQRRDVPAAPGPPHQTPSTAEAPMIEPEPAAHPATQGRRTSMSSSAPWSA
jgi:hypothetical protein